MKPESPEEALAMLRELAGKDHFVFTGVCVARGHQKCSEAERVVYFFTNSLKIKIHTYYHQLPSPR